VDSAAAANGSLISQRQSDQPTAVSDHRSSFRYRDGGRSTTHCDV